MFRWSNQTIKINIPTLVFVYVYYLQFWIMTLFDDKLFETIET